MIDLVTVFNVGWSVGWVIFLSLYLNESGKSERLMLSSYGMWREKEELQEENRKLREENDRLRRHNCPEYPEQDPPWTIG